MKNVRLLTKDELCDSGGSKKGTLSQSYAVVREAIKNLPGFDQGFFINPKSGGKDEDFPDDSRRVDVTFGLKDEETGEVLVVWNYKNGPVYNPSEKKTLDDISSFSIGYGGEDKEPSASLLSALMKACDIVKNKQ